MAMLAEKRTKTRYYLHHKALNPRGNAWCEDSSKFGQRMLEKMGWSQGKGLGVHEDGSTDPVTVSYKWDSKGMGYKGADGDEAVAQQKDFDALLATLSQDSSLDGKSTATPEKSPKSLELMSQKSRARVHYHKFTRGKDLSRASSKDLASILGMATELKTSAPTSPGPIVKPDVGPPIEQSMVTTFGITTIARGNINEYFKQKFEERKRKLTSCESEDDVKRSKVSDDTAILAVTRDVDESLDDNSQPETVNNKKKKKKKKNKVEEKNEIDCNSSPLLDDTLQDDSDPSSSKSRRKSVTWGDVEVSFVSKYIKDMVDTSSDSVNGDSDPFVSVTVEDETNAISKKKKKKDKKKRKELSCELVEQKSEDDEVLDETNSTIKKKKKRKGKQVSGDTEDGTSCESAVVKSFEEIGSHITGAQNSATEETPLKKKKKKRKRSSDELEEHGSSVESSENAEAGVANVSSAKKQKKKKVKDVLEDVVLEINDGSSCEDSQISPKTKKHKVKQTICDDVAASEKKEEITRKRKDGENEEKILDSSIAEEFSETKKKKKKKKEILETEICEEIKLDQPESNYTASALSLNTNKCEKVNKKKKKKSMVVDPDNNSEVGNECVDDSNNHPALSALTQERMAKWKDRRKSKDVKTSTEELISESSKTEKSRTAKVEYNPNQPTQDYNHRKVLSTLGYNVKGATDKTITVRMPESNFAGSNLDAIPGYGQTIKSC